MANRPKFGTNFKKRADINNDTLKSTKTIGFGSFSQEQKEEIKQRLSSPTKIQENTADINRFLPESNLGVKKIPRKLLKAAPDEWNFFSKPSKDKLIMLAESIYKNGLLQPIIVRKMNPEGTIYQILAGHTRNAVYDMLYQILEDPKYLDIDAIIYDYNEVDDNKAQDIICDTNFMQRGNLPPREMAKCVLLKSRRIKEGIKYGEGSVAEKIAKEYNIKRTSVFMWQKLANLIDEIGELVDQRKITLKNAYKIACLKQEDQKILYKECSNFISNESIRNIDTKSDIGSIIKSMEKDYGIQVRSIRYEIPETSFKTPKDEPILVFCNPKDKEHLIELIKSSGLGYLV